MWKVLYCITSEQTCWVFWPLLFTQKQRFWEISKFCKTSELWGEGCQLSGRDQPALGQGCTGSNPHIQLPRLGARLQTTAASQRLSLIFGEPSSEPYLTQRVNLSSPLPRDHKLRGLGMNPIESASTTSLGRIIRWPCDNVQSCITVGNPAKFYWACAVSQPPDFE